MSDGEQSRPAFVVPVDLPTLTGGDHRLVPGSVTEVPDGRAVRSTRGLVADGPARQVGSKALGGTVPERYTRRALAAAVGCGLTGIR